MDQDIPDYDMDSADELWVEEQSKRMDLDVLKFEMMMDKLEKSSGQTVVTLNEAKALLKQDDELSIAVYDYWLNKRLTTVRVYSSWFSRLVTNKFSFFSNIHSSFRSRRKIVEIWHRTTLTLHLDDVPRRCRRGKTGKMMSRRTKRCSN